MNWKQPRDPQTLNAQSKGCSVEHLAIEFIDSDESSLRATMPVDERTRQPFGLLHGGASVLLAETIGSMAGNLCVDDDHFCVGQSITANHIRSVTEGYVTGTARPRHLGRNSQVWQIDIVDDAERLICTTVLTLAVLARG